MTNERTEPLYCLGCGERDWSEDREQHPDYDHDFQPAPNERTELPSDDLINSTSQTMTSDDYEAEVDGHLLFRLDTVARADSTAAEWDLLKDAAAEIRRLGRLVDALRADYNIAARCTKPNKPPNGDTR